MTFASQQTDGGIAPAVPSSRSRHRSIKVKAFATAAGVAACLFLLSIFLPDHLATLAQDVMCWFLLAASGTALLIAGVKFLDGFLDL